MRTAVAIALLALGALPPLSQAAAPATGGAITLLYSVDDRGEVKPCG